jgi:hypothetical protein
MWYLALRRRNGSIVALFLACSAAAAADIRRCDGTRCQR